jgi:hypothetical protein
MSREHKRAVESLNGEQLSNQPDCKAYIIDCANPSSKRVSQFWGLCIDDVPKALKMIKEKF